MDIELIGVLRRLGPCPRQPDAPAALRDAGLAAALAGWVRLVFIDGHEDDTTMAASQTGEAASMEIASMEIAILLGPTGQRSP